MLSFADRTSTATMQANQLRLWFASMAYVLLCGLRRIGLAHTQFAEATCGTTAGKALAKSTPLFSSPAISPAKSRTGGHDAAALSRHRSPD
jgi:hypothetical protein